jgi:hypothetical protein
MTRNGLRAERARERFEEELRQEFKRTQQQQHTKASSDPHTPADIADIGLGNLEKAHR